MGQIALSVATIPKSGLPKDLRLLKQQFNIMLVSFENAGISLPPFRQLHYFETSSFLFELLKKFYFGIFLELQKKVMNVGFYLDAFGNPAGFVTDLKDFFAGLFIEGDVLFQIPCYGGWRKEALRIPRIRRLVCAHNGNDRFCAMGRAESTESTTRRRSTTIEKRATTTEHDRLRYAETKI
ncbi:unnamed protein product, partial [Mesorhabditis belari]|uniref:Uncharacterized protein n=1 Tax=Mesorhabditis belari TaxID=2138241 RepID=A0AAF3FN12_9BILA